MHLAFFPSFHQSLSTTTANHCSISAILVAMLSLVLATSCQCPRPTVPSSATPEHHVATLTSSTSERLSRNTTSTRVRTHTVAELTVRRDMHGSRGTAGARRCTTALTSFIWGHTRALGDSGWRRWLPLRQSAASKSEMLRAGRGSTPHGTATQYIAPPWSIVSVRRRRNSNCVATQKDSRCHHRRSDSRISKKKKAVYLPAYRLPTTTATCTALAPVMVPTAPHPCACLWDSPGFRAHRFHANLLVT